MINSVRSPHAQMSKSKAASRAQKKKKKSETREENEARAMKNIDKFARAAVVSVARWNDIGSRTITEEKCCLMSGHHVLQRNALRGPKATPSAP